MNIPLVEVRARLEDAVASAAKRTQAQQGQVERIRGVAGSREVFAGTRIPVAAVQAFVEDGYDDDAILAEYPSLTAADLQFARMAHNNAA